MAFRLSLLSVLLMLSRPAPGADWGSAVERALGAAKGYGNASATSPASVDRPVAAAQWRVRSAVPIVDFAVPASQPADLRASIELVLPTQRCRIPADLESLHMSTASGPFDIEATGDDFDVLWSFSRIRAKEPFRTGTGNPRPGAAKLLVTQDGSEHEPLVIPDKCRRISVAARGRQAFSVYTFAVSSPRSSYMASIVPLLPGDSLNLFRDGIAGAQPVRAIAKGLNEGGLGLQAATELAKKVQTRLLALSDEELYRRICAADADRLRKAPDADTAAELGFLFLGQVAPLVDSTPIHRVKLTSETVYFALRNVGRKRVGTGRQYTFEVSDFDLRGSCQWFAVLRGIALDEVEAEREVVDLIHLMEQPAAPPDWGPAIEEAIGDKVRAAIPIVDFAVPASRPAPGSTPIELVLPGRQCKLPGSLEKVHLEMNIGGGGTFDVDAKGQGFDLTWSFSADSKEGPILTGTGRSPPSSASIVVQQDGHTHAALALPDKCRNIKVSPRAGVTEVPTFDVTARKMFYQIYLQPLVPTDATNFQRGNIANSDSVEAIAKGLHEAGMSYEGATELSQKVQARLLSLSDEDLFRQIFSADVRQLRNAPDAETAVRLGFLFRGQAAPLYDNPTIHRVKLPTETVYFVLRFLPQNQAGPDSPYTFEVSDFDSKGKCQWFATIDQKAATELEAQRGVLEFIDLMKQ